jgi:exopolysaccharide biosynthesis polyprenyl glycosylphosphotransferase
MLREHGTFTTQSQKFIDIAITGLSFIAAYHIKNFMLPGPFRGLITEPNYYIILLAIIITWYISFSWMGIYLSYRQSLFYQFFVKIIKSVFLGMVLLNIALYIFHVQDISRLLMGLFLVINISLLTLSKYIIYKTLKQFRARGINTRNVLVVGSRERAKDVIKSVEKNRDTGYKVLGCFDIEKELLGSSVVNGHRVIGVITDLKDFLENNIVDELIFAMPMRLIDNAGRYLTLAETMGVKVRIIPDWQIDHLMYQPGIAEIRVEDFLGLYTMSLQTTPPNEGRLFIKTLGDYAIAAILLIMSIPIFLMSAIAIKLFSKGPVFYKQKRLGLSGRHFTLYKFRTMVENADELLKELKEKNEADGPAFKIEKDPRIIPWIGTFLRRTSLDELPQLINVLKGEMSMVGPRPPIPSEVDEYSIWQRRRLSMKPGLTCFWQISPRRNDLSFNEWMRLDLKYIDTWSLFNDLKLIVLTLRAVLFGAGR